MIFIYLETPLGVPGNYVLYPLQDIFPASTAASNDCPVVDLTGNCGEIWVFVDKSKIHMEWYFWMVLHNFFLNGNSLFELNMSGILSHHPPPQYISIWPVNGMGTSHVIRQDRAVYITFLPRALMSC